MTDQPINLPALEDITGATVADVLARLPRMGRVMVIAKTDRGVTHERIGAVEAVTRDAGDLRLKGACHDGLVKLDAAVRMRIDRRSVMQGKIYPHLNILDSAGNIVLDVVGMEGTEPMEEALIGITRAPLAAQSVPAVTRRDAPDIAETDPALIMLRQLHDKGAQVTITAKTAALTQVWRGQVDAVKPAMGFINVMTPDFHLHLKAGSIAAWGGEPGRRIALDAKGAPCGLTLDAEVFA